MIKSKTQYKKKLARIEQIFDIEPHTKEGKELEKLAKEVEQYEKIHYPLPKPTAEDIRIFNKEQLGLYIY